MAVPEPDTQTRKSLHSGRTRSTESFSWNIPRSNNIIRATDVIGFVIE